MRSLSISSSVRDYSLVIVPNAFEEVSRIMSEGPCYILAAGEFKIKKINEVKNDYFL